jgi:predicted RNA binding protein YcfA (HicA-like mRNA interferase family)
MRRWEYVEVRQTGSHIILRTESPSRQTVSIPAHKPLKRGTAAGILGFVAKHKGIDEAELLREL